MKPTLTIGILAYNEAGNIGSLLSALLNQKIDSATLSEILVVSDQSTDGTDDIVRSFRTQGVTLIRQEKRGGANQVQNTMMDHAKTDILVMLDGDILPETDLLIESLVLPLLSKGAIGLTSAALLPANPRTFVEQVLAWNHEWKWRLFKSIGDGHNIYTCVGPARAFSKRLYKAFHFSDTVPYDAASYLFCMKEKLTFVSVNFPRAVFRCPNNLRDHLKQSTRFASGKDSLAALFGDEVRNMYSIPYGLVINRVLRECLFHPIYALSFFVIWAIARSRKVTPFTASWDMATSTKK